MTPRLSRIRVYPIKSMDGRDLDSASLRSGAGLASDREYRLVDEDGRVVNSKRFGAKLIAIRASFEGNGEEVVLKGVDDSIQARLQDEAEGLGAWLSRQLGLSIRLEQGSQRGFPDDEDASGPTIVSEATLEEVADWFPGGTVEEMRHRFRANLEIAGVPAFWEDRLFGLEGEARFFEIGCARLEAVNPCARCAVPSMDSLTGQIADRGFAKQFSRRREETLPAEVERQRFDHFYRLTVNTRVPPFDGEGRIQVGDELRVL